MRPTVIDVACGLQAEELCFGPAEEHSRAIEADCPLCADETGGYRPLLVTEREPGGPAWLECRSGCVWWEILEALGWDWELLADDPEPDDAPRLRLLDVDRMLASDPPPIPWVAKPLLARGVVTMLVGREGQGKSLLALALAAAVGRGDMVAGIECERGRVLVVDAENGETETARRLSGFDVASQTLAYAETGDFDLRAHLHEVEALLSRLGPDVLVLDSLRSLAPGLEENDSGPVEAALGPLRRLARKHECAILVLHHAGKANNAYRGSTAIGAAVEIGFTLTSTRADEDDGHRTLTCWKCRIAAKAAPFAFRIETNGERVSIAAAQTRNTPDPGPSRAEELAQRLGEMAEEHGPLPWGELCRLVGVDPESGTTKRARKLAIEHGLLVQHKTGVYGPPPPPTDRPHPIEETDGRPTDDTDEERGA